jgi:nucleoside-diphosphate-sugar epimerase
MSNAVLVTGASGFIGRMLTPLLVREGYEVHAVRRRLAEPELAGVRWHSVDLLAPGASETLVESVRASHLVHLAWYAVPQSFWSSDRNISWVEASLRLVRSFAAAGGRRAVLAGSCAEYDLTDGLCVENVTPRRPASLYGACKNALQQVVAEHSRSAGYSAAWPRIFFAYGPGEPPGRLVPSVVVGLRDGQRVELSDGDRQRDFVYVEDVAVALARLLSSDVEGPINVGSGQATSIRDIVHEIGSTMERPELVRFGAQAAHDGDPQLVVADTRRLNDELGWTPAVSLEAGIARTVEWWRGDR